MADFDGFCGLYRSLLVYFIVYNINQQMMSLYAWYDSP